MIKIGLTGGICSGKSTTLKIMRELGCHTISSDEINKELMKKDIRLIEKLKKTFNCVDENGNINYRMLKELIFNNEGAKKQLEKLTHPLIKLVRQNFFKKAENYGSMFAICESPLIFEKKLLDEFDLVILVKAPIDKRIDRFIESRQGNQEMFFKIAKTQMLDNKKELLANYIIENNGSEQELKQKIRKLLNTIEKKYTYK